MPPAARVTDMHTCPMFTGPVPHVGGPILPPGAPTVLIDFLPAATVTNMLTCVGPPDVIVKGSAGVFINFLPAARMGDMTAHGGVIILGAPNVIIGEIGSPSPGAAGLGAVVAGMVMSGVGTPSQENASLLSASHPLAAHGHAGHPKKKAQNPCAGKGLDTPENQKEFAADMKTVQKDWPKLSPAQREDRLKTMANKQLAKSGVPPVDVTENPSLSHGTDGEMAFEKWSLDMNPKLMTSPHLSNAQTKTLGDEIYHESRHAEQWYLIGRNEAAAGKSADDIGTDTGIKASTAKAAYANKLEAKDPMKPCADAMQASVYGAGKAHREKVLTEGPAKRAAADAANKHYEAVSKNPASTYEQKLAAYNRAVAAGNISQANYNQYRALPEEADAWHTGGGVGNLLAH